MYAHQLIINPQLLDVHFSATRISMPRACSGYFALLNSDVVEKLAQSYPSIFSNENIGFIQNNVSKCWFIISEQGRKPNKSCYLAIIDGAAYSNPTVGQRTRTAGHNRKKQYKYYMHGDGVSLHKRIDKILNIPLGGIAAVQGYAGAIHIHHDNYCAFDNRIGNLVKLSPRDHRRRHKGKKIFKSMEIRNEQMLAQFIVDFFH